MVFIGFYATGMQRIAIEQPLKTYRLSLFPFKTDYSNLGLANMQTGLGQHANWTCPTNVYHGSLFRNVLQIMNKTIEVAGEVIIMAPTNQQNCLFYRKKPGLKQLIPSFCTTYKRLLVFCRKVFLSFEINSAYVGKPSSAFA